MKRVDIPITQREDQDMIFNLADDDFMQLMDNPELHLPKRWDGKDFETTLQSLFDTYTNELSYYCENNGNNSPYQINVNFAEIQSMCDDLIKCIREYHNGFPARAFSAMKRIMERLIETPLEIYQKTGPLGPLEEDRLYLYRTRAVNSGATFKRENIFHVPTSARSMISTCRYSIAGYPSLYLSTSIDLALEETSANPAQVIVSRFKLDRAQPEINIQVLELGIKPQDFSPTGLQRENNLRLFGEHGQQSRSSLDLGQSYVRSTYLRWYPLIAACSFIRANKSAPFASEYIIPQLLMQWIRTQCKRNHLVGLRYFSCASARASDMGFDYVFPVSNGKCEGGYCSVLRDSFSLTEPVYLRDYKELWQCEEELLHLLLDKIKS